MVSVINKLTDLAETFIHHNSVFDLFYSLHHVLIPFKNPPNERCGSYLYNQKFAFIMIHIILLYCIPGNTEIFFGDCDWPVQCLYKVNNTETVKPQKKTKKQRLNGALQSKVATSSFAVLWTDRTEKKCMRPSFQVNIVSTGTLHHC